MQQRSIKILSTGKYLPKHKVTAQALAERIGVSSQWIEKKSGVMVRYFVADETTSQMATFAAKEALASANLSIQAIDCIVCANTVPEQGIPCTAALVQRQFGQAALGIPAFDLNATCLSFVTAFDTLSYLIEAGRYQRILLISSEIATHALDWSDHESCTLFGDGAAAAIIEKSTGTETSSILSARMETYSEAADLAQCLGGGNKHHPRDYLAHPESFVFQMQGRAIYRMASKILPGFLARLFEPMGITMADIDLVIPHQASLMSMRLLRKQLEIPEDRLMVIAHDHGNTIAAAIPMALHEAIHQGKLKRGDRALLLGTAAGFSVGGIVLEY
jgi:3-oxoacyl-[acyl-carrier-protein] synthase III